MQRAPCRMRSRKASSMETGSTRGVRSRMSWRTSRPAMRYFSMFGLDHHRVRAGFERLEHRHGGAHAVGARHVAGGRHDAALAAADDHRLVGEARVVPLLDGGEERVAIHMGDGEAVALRVPEQARGAAGRCSASRRGWRRGSGSPGRTGASLTAAGSTRTRTATGSRWAPMMRSGLSSSRFASAIEERLVGRHIVENGGEEAGRGRRASGSSPAAGPRSPGSGRAAPRRS